MYKTSAGSTWTTVSSSSASLTISGLTASTSYIFQVQSNCSGSTSSYSSASSFTTFTPSCNVPSALIASSVTSNAATLSWASTGAVSYNVMYKSASASTWTTVTVTSNSKALSGLSPNTTYQFQVQSVCSGSSSAYCYSPLLQQQEKAAVRHNKLIGGNGCMAKFPTQRSQESKFLI